MAEAGSLWTWEVEAGGSSVGGQLCLHMTPISKKRMGLRQVSKSLGMLCTSEVTCLRREPTEPTCFLRTRKKQKTRQADGDGLRRPRTVSGPATSFRRKSE